MCHCKSLSSRGRHALHAQASAGSNPFLKFSDPARGARRSDNGSASRRAFQRRDLHLSTGDRHLSTVSNALRVLQVRDDQGDMVSSADVLPGRWPWLTGRPARALLLLALTGALLTPATAPASGLTSGSWFGPEPIMGSMKDLVGGSGQSGLTAISCPSTSFCVAMGTAVPAKEPKTRYAVAVTYNGSSKSWSAPADLAGVEEPVAVSCSSASFCLSTTNKAQSVTYNRSSWSAPTSLPSSAGEAESVSCTSATHCVAVADDTGHSESVTGSGALTYNGSSWSAATAIDNESLLYSVSCASASFCAAVGGGPEELANALIYNGSSWSAPHTVDSRGVTVTSVSCPSVSFCAAVDWNGDALTYNGHSWSAPVHVASAAPADEVAAVSCASPWFCMAVGEAKGDQGDALTYNGRSWSAPRIVGHGGGFTAVSCPSATFCVAVDNGGNAFVYYVVTAPHVVYERSSSLRMSPRSVHAGGQVHVSGSIARTGGRLICPVGGQVELFSPAFAPSSHEFAGVPTAYAKFARNGSFSARATIPAHRHPGVYVVHGRCEGGNLLVWANLRVLSARLGSRRRAPVGRRPRH
jgi:hypothetical protein